jgi:hypothetical protein
MKYAFGNFGIVVIAIKRSVLTEADIQCHEGRSRSAPAKQPFFESPGEREEHEHEHNSAFPPMAFEV